MGADAPALVCEGLTVSYGDVTVLDGLDLTVAAGETVALLGPSGSGKTTLLYAVAGFVEPTSGEIVLSGTPVHGRRGVPPEGREVGLVFQNYALWPHMDARETVAYPLRRRGMDRGSAWRRAQELLETMGIGDLAGRRPDQLSGGQQQRVGLARALARDARLYLMDEPTAHLDAPLRAALQREIATIRQRTGAAALYATHDASEALAVADRVALLRHGRLMQIGTPVDVYERPVDLWAAELTGPVSVLEAPVVAAGHGVLSMRLGDTTVEVAAPDGPSTDRTARVLVRPEWARLGGDGVAAELTGVSFHGPHTDHHLATPAGRLTVRTAGLARARAGEAVRVVIERGWALPRGD